MFYYHFYFYFLKLRQGLTRVAFSSLELAVQTRLAPNLRLSPKFHLCFELL